MTITGTGESSPGFTVSTHDVESSLLHALNDARASLQLYSIKDSNGNWVNPDLVVFYQNQIARIEQEMLAEGLATQINGAIIPIQQQAITVTVDPIVAQAGRIRVITDQLSGTGTFDAPRDAKIEIINNTPAFLIINGEVLTAPVEGAGTIGGVAAFNGLLAFNYDDPSFGYSSTIKIIPRAAELLDYTPGKIQQSTINVDGQLKKAVNLTPFNLDPIGRAGGIEDPLFRPVHADDIIYGGWGGRLPQRRRQPRHR